MPFAGCISTHIAPPPSWGVPHPPPKSQRCSKAAHSPVLPSPAPARRHFQGTDPQPHPWSPSVPSRPGEHPGILSPSSSPYLCGTAWGGGRQRCAWTPGFFNIYRDIYLFFFISVFFLPPPASFRRKRTYLGKARQKPASFGGRHCRKEEVLAISELLTRRFPEAAGLGVEWQGQDGELVAL